MSNFQPQQQQQQPQPQQEVQPVVVYPNPLTNQPASSSSHRRHSDGSFGTVFIVLAVIAVLSAIACLLGRLCNRRISAGHVSQKHNNNNNNKNKSQSAQNSRPTKDQTRVHHDQFARAKDHRGDIEFGNSDNVRNKNRDDRGDHIEFGFDNVRPSSSSAAPNGKPVGNGMRSGSRGYVAFEKNGDHATAKPHGGGGGGGGGDQYHDYHGGPRASD